MKPNSTIYDYIPFGNDWKKEMMKWRKSDLIEIYKKSSLALDEKDKRIKELEDGLREFIEAARSVNPYKLKYLGLDTWNDFFKSLLTKEQSKP